ncbi:MAG: transglycosylase domain-containing protein [Cyclobacteriaceae bacterium]|nr:transglycosylase domain-containing protein [Cyclobacteriaceae bacterium]
MINFYTWIRVRLNQSYSYLISLPVITSILVVAGWFVGGILTFLIVLFLFTWLGIFGSLPDKQELIDIKNPTASEVYSADSVLLGRYFFQERSNVSFNDFPSHVIDELVATEDVRFYNHDGIDFRSLGRVVIKSILLQNKAAGGGSTITQQLAKNLFPRKSYWFFELLINKMRELIIASRLEKVYNKDSILTLYLNTVSFGGNAFGLEAAAQRFFSVTTKDLTIGQSALLIGMLKATHGYNPRVYPEKALVRRNVVLAQFQKYKELDPDFIDSLQAIPIELKYNKITHHSGLAPYFREQVRADVLTWCEDYNAMHEQPINLYTSGLKIYTTIDSRLQVYAEQAMERQMKKIQQTFLGQWSKNEPWQRYPEMINEVVANSDHYKSLKLTGMSHEEALIEMNKPALMNLFTWEGEKEVIMSPIDSIKHYLKFLNSGFLALDPITGSVKAWVGGINHEYFQYDHVRESTKRQVGSIFKPIVYAAALERGEKPCDFTSAEKIIYTNMEDWAPENTEDNYGLKYSMPGALAKSVNTVSVRIIEEAGIENTVLLAHKMGVKSKLSAVPSLALGTAEISMMEMVTVYSCFANEGRRVKPFYINSISNHENEILSEFKSSEIIQALKKENAELMLHMLRRAVNEGTSSSLRSQFGLMNDIAGKTGTTQSNTDGWFIAITPKLVMGAWVGGDDPRIRFRSTNLGQGSRTALPIVGEFLKLCNADKSLNLITHAKFPELTPFQKRKIDCDLFKTDATLVERIFGKNKEKDNRKEFGKKGTEKKGLFKRLFGRRE